MRILLVDDSALARGLMKKALEESGFTVAGQASNGQAGFEMARDLDPDLVIMDINMPVMDGLAATAEIMKSHPVPIIVFSTELDAMNSFKALSSGAVDIMQKPGIADYNNPSFFQAMKEKIVAVSRVNVRRRSAIALERPTEAAVGAARFRLLVMGASTGGPQAISEIVARLPADFPLGIILVQHLESGFDQSYADWLNEQSPLAISLAVEGALPRSGELFVAPVGVHVCVADNRLAFEDSPPIVNQKPAVDVLFRSAARALGNSVLGVLLTGMGADGAKGCVEIRKAGGHTVVQDRGSSAIFGMPKAAIEMDGASEVRSLEDIPDRLCALAGVAR